MPLSGGGAFRHWFEHVEGGAEVTLTTQDGRPAVVAAGGLMYLAGWPDDAAFDRLVRSACAAEGIETQRLPDGLRLRDTATHRFVFNYAPEPLDYAGTPVPPAGVVWHPIGAAATR